MDKNLIGLAAGVLTAISLIPQFIKCIKEKKADEISPFMLIILFFGNGLWAYYGFVIDAMPVLITNIFSLVMDCALLVVKVIYRKKGR